MKAVLLAGGLGTRMREETEYRPKPMVEVGGKPILWHIMRNLAHFGVTDFVIASGYKSEVIDAYFSQSSDWVGVIEERSNARKFRGTGDEGDWTVTVAFTGDETPTGGRVVRVRELLDGERFFVTYGDGLADVNIDQLINVHERSGRLATLTAVQPTSRFGLMDVDETGAVSHFREKPKMKDWVSIGFFIFEPPVLDYLVAEGGLEEEGLTRLAADGQLSAHKHEGFWQPMDTYREYLILQELWESGSSPWKVW
jgi:glucose-1-phosphate cytidylyltransferase